MNLIPVNNTIVRARIAEIQKSLNKLKKLVKLPFEKFTKEHESYAIAEHYFRRALEATISLATHIVSRIPSEKFTDYTSVFFSLGRSGVIPKDFAEKIAPLAKVRNRLVHVYWEVDERELYDKIKEYIDDFDRFCEYIVEYVKNL